MSRTASVETVNRGEHSCVHPTSKMIDPEILQEAYGGTLANFIAALTGKDSITEIDKDELLDYITS